MDHIDISRDFWLWEWCVTCSLMCPERRKEKGNIRKERNDFIIMKLFIRWLSVNCLTLRKSDQKKNKKRERQKDMCYDKTFSFGLFQLFIWLLCEELPLKYVKSM